MGHQRLGLAVRNIAEITDVGQVRKAEGLGLRLQTAAARNGEHGLRRVFGRAQHPGEVFVFEQVGHGEIILPRAQSRPFARACKNAFVRPDAAHMLPGVIDDRDAPRVRAIVAHDLAFGKFRHSDDLFRLCGHGAVLQAVPGGAQPPARVAVKIRPRAVADIMPDGDTAAGGRGRQRDDIAHAQPAAAMPGEVGRVVPLFPKAVYPAMHDDAQVIINRLGRTRRHNDLDAAGRNDLVELRQYLQRIALDAGDPLGEEPAVHRVERLRLQPRRAVRHLPRAGFAGAGARQRTLQRFDVIRTRHGGPPLSEFRVKSSDAVERRCAAQKSGKNIAQTATAQAFSPALGPWVLFYSRPAARLAARTRSTRALSSLSGQAPVSTASTTASNASGRPAGISSRSTPASSAASAASPAV